MSQNIGRILLVIALSGTGPAFAADTAPPVRLENGSFVFVDDSDGTTRMVDRNGKPEKMREGVEMQTADGGVIVMRNNRIWKLVGPPGKQRRFSVDD